MTLMRGRRNYLAGVNAHFEAGIGTWVANSNATIAHAPGQGRPNMTPSFLTNAVALTSVASGNMSARHVGSPSSGINVNPGRTAHAEAWFKPDAVARSYQLSHAWYDASSVLISSPFGPSFAGSMTEWTLAYFDDVAPANAAFLHVRAFVLSTGGANEVHYVDDVSLSIPNLNCCVDEYYGWLWP